MPRPQKPARARGRLPLSMLLIAVLAGAAVAGLAAVAIGRSFTLSVARGAKVTDQRHHVAHEPIVIGPSGFALYWLSGDRPAHPKCTAANGCFGFWPPLTVASARRLSRDAAIHGKLTTWKRGNRTQVVLGGHPLYFFALDRQRRAATGEGVVGFGGTWHVATPAAPRHASGSPAPAAPMTTTGTTTTETTTTGTTTLPYGY